MNTQICLTENIRGPLPPRPRPRPPPRLPSLPPHPLRVAGDNVEGRERGEKRQGGRRRKKRREGGREGGRGCCCCYCYFSVFGGLALTGKRAMS